MNIKKLVFVSIIALLPISCLSVASAGLFGNDVEASTFKIECPDGFHQENYVQVLYFLGDDDVKFVGDSLYLTDDNNDTP